MNKLEATLKMQKAMTVFFTNHPKVSGFVTDLKNKGVCEGTEIAVAVRYPDGTEYKTGIRVKPGDLEALATLKSLSKE